GCGLLRSTDGGTTWTQVGAPNFGNSLTYAQASFGKILVVPGTAGSTTTTTVLAATNAGLFRSTNSGMSWSNVLSGVAVSSLVSHPTTQGVIFAGTRNGMYRSADFGAHWALEPIAGVSASSIARMELATSQAAPDQVIALLGNQSNSKFLALYRWNDAAL